MPEADVLNGGRLIASNWMPNGPRAQDVADIGAYRIAVGSRDSNYFPNGIPFRTRELIEELSPPVPFGGGG